MISESSSGRGDEPKPTRAASDLTAEVDALLATEAHLLDSRAYLDWLQLFTEDCLYWMPVDPHATDGSQGLNLVYDDRPRLQSRIARLLSGNAHTENPPSSTVRTIGAVRIFDDDHNGEPAILVESHFVLVAHRLGDQRVFGGRYGHRIVREAEGFRIAEKRVAFLGSDAPQRHMTFLF